MMTASLLLAIAIASSPEAADPDLQAFSQARRLEQWDVADALADRLKSNPGWARLVTEYYVYDRGRCDVTPDALGASVGEASLRFDLLICQAAHLDASDPRGADRILAHLMADPGDAFGLTPAGSFDRFARVRKPDVEVLSYLHRHHFDLWPKGWAPHGMQIQLFRLSPAALTSLLDGGVDPNEPVGEERRLPLQVLRDASWKKEPQALAAAQLLLDHGADPTMLAWYRPGAKQEGPIGKPGSAAFEEKLRVASLAIDPVRVDYLETILIDIGGDSVREGVRVRIGNASTAPVGLSAWRSGDQLYCSLHVLDYEYRMPIGGLWMHHVSIEDGPSPEGISIPPGQFREMVCDQDLLGPPGSEYRLELNLSDGKQRYSQPFLLGQGPKSSVKLPSIESWR